MTRTLTLLLAILCLWRSPDILAQAPLICGTDLEGGIPYLFGNKDHPVGFEVDLMDALAKELGHPIERKHAPFDSLLATLQRGDVDVAMNGLEITPLNLQQARFTRPYYIYQLQLIARDDDNRFTALDDCRDKKLKVGTISGSVAARLLQEKGVPFKFYDDQEGPFLDLKQRAIDGVLFDMPIALYYVIQDNGLKYRKKAYPGLQFVGAPFAEGFYGIAVRKNNPALQKELDAALGRVIQSGELKRILTKWHLWSPEQYRLGTPASSAEEDGDADALSLPFRQSLALLLDGARVTILISIAGMALAVLLGLPIATARLYGPAPIRWLAIGYIEFFRGIPVLLLLYFLYYALPEICKQLSDYYGLPQLRDALKFDPRMVAVVGFGLNYAAYEAEIYRNGIQTIPLGQWEAAASLGMSPLLTFRRIVFPQSFRVILPPMTNDFIALFKDTSVVSIISVIELSKEYQILTKTYGDFFQIGLTTAALYLIMSVPLGYLSRYLEKRWGVK